MVVEQVFKAYLYPDPLSALEDGFNIDNGIDITEGILNINIISGNEIYEGPQQQIDTGQFTIITRNPAMDPKINPNLKYNSAIKFYDERSGEFFRGYVTDVQVQYQREDNPIITITGTDIFGAMQRVVVSQATHNTIMALSTGPTWNGITFSEFLPYMYDFTAKYLDLDAITPANYPDPQGFWFDATQGFAEQDFGNLGYSPAKYIPNVGESYLDIINKYAQTNLTSFAARGEFGYDYINVYSFPKYDPHFWPPQQDPITKYITYDFSSDPADERPYESILIDNGYNRVINQVDISNEYRYVEDGELKSTTEGFTRLSNESIEEYAISRASISTIYPEDASLSNSNWANRYSTNIFQVTSFPGQEIQQITFNNARPEDIENDFSYSDYNINQIIRIKHKINNAETIDRIYDIAGITHNISPDKWEMGFTLKPSKEELVYNFQTGIPSIEMNALSGDSNFNFTATITAIDPAKVGSVVWVLSAVDSNEITELWPYATSGNMFKDGLPRTGLTQTWNFDDDGILAPYSFDPNSTYQNPTDNRYGNYGVGIYYVSAYVFLTNQFVIALPEKQLTIGTPAVSANFEWQQNLTNNFGQVTFTDQSVNNEQGESDSYLWTFGDGTTSTLRNPVKQYDPSPTTTQYTVTLKVFAYGPGQAKIFNTTTKTITLQRPTMTPNFTWTSNFETLTFTNTSTNVGFEEPDAYFWEFGDGTTSTLKNPVHTFPVTNASVATNFSVKLTTRNIWEQTANVTKTVSVLAENTSGTYPVKYIKLSTAVTQRSGSGLEYYALTPVFRNFRGMTSNTNQNLIINAPLIGPGNVIDNVSPSYLPQYEYVSASNSGSYPNPVYGISKYLTRDDGNEPGLTAPMVGVGVGVYNNPQGIKVRHELVIQIPETAWYKMANLDAFVESLYKDYVIQTESFFPKINVSVATTVTNFTFNPLDVYGPPTLNGDWVDIGYFKFYDAYQFLRVTMTKTRPLPMNIPYFLYTFGTTAQGTDKQVTFTSVETAPAGGSYLWTFGDGTTSALKDPVKTYAAYGTYNVNLTIKSSGGTTIRSTTEPVIVQATII